jgi:hypothetical protein
LSVATPAVMAANVEAIAAHRESLAPYVKAVPEPQGQEAQEQRWTSQLAAGRAADDAQALLLGRGPGDPDVALALRRLTLEYPWYAPGKALFSEYEAALALEPRLLEQAAFRLKDESGGTVGVEISAVLVPVSKTRASVMFVDNRSRTVYGQVYVDDYDREDRAKRTGASVMEAVRSAYEAAATGARSRKEGLPPATGTLRGMAAAISAKVQNGQPNR